MSLLDDLKAERETQRSILESCSTQRRQMREAENAAALKLMDYDLAIAALEGETTAPRSAAGGQQDDSQQEAQAQPETPILPQQESGEQEGASATSGEETMIENSAAPDPQPEQAGEVAKASCVNSDDIPLDWAPMPLTGAPERAGYTLKVIEDWESDLKLHRYEPAKPAPVNSDDASTVELQGEQPRTLIIDPGSDPLDAQEYGAAAPIPAEDAGLDAEPQLKAATLEDAW